MTIIPEYQFSWPAALNYAIEVVGLDKLGLSLTDTTSNQVNWPEI